MNIKNIWRDIISLKIIWQI